MSNRLDDSNRQGDLMPQIMELYKEWCRLKGYSLGTKPIEVMIDEATGAEKARMTEFVHWLSLEVMTRLPKEADTNVKTAAYERPYTTTEAVKNAPGGTQGKDTNGTI